MKRGRGEWQGMMCAGVDALAAAAGGSGGKWSNGQVNGMVGVDGRCLQR